MLHVDQSETFESQNICCIFVGYIRSFGDLICSSFRWCANIGEGEGEGGAESLFMVTRSMKAVIVIRRGCYGKNCRPIKSSC